MIMRVDNMEAIFNVCKAIQFSIHYEYLAMISMVEEKEKICDLGVYLDDSLDKTLLLFDGMYLMRRSKRWCTI